jgi:hypothetical protein
MASSNLSPTFTALKPGVAEAPVEENPVARQPGRGFWGALRWRTQNIFWNYMAQQAQLGLYPTSDEYGDT